MAKREEGWVLIGSKWIYRHTHCACCDKPLSKSRHESGNPFCSTKCAKEAAGEAAAESRFLEAAEGGSGIEKVRDAHYHVTYTEE